MKRQPYFPRTVEGRPEWFGNYAQQLPTANVVLGLPALEVTASVADARYLEYVTGAWLKAVREFGPACTSAIDELFSGPGGAAFVLPDFEAPPLPAGPPAVVAVPSGALDRIFEFVKAVKARPGYTDAIGLQLGVVGSADSAEHPLPTFTLKSEMGDTCHCVLVTHRKFGHMANVIESRRGNGDWEQLAIATDSPFEDERPLLVANVPEVREYRLRFWDSGQGVGEWTPVQRITVSP